MSDKRELLRKAFKVVKGCGRRVVVSTSLLVATLIYCAGARKPVSEFAAQFDPTPGTTANPGWWRRRNICTNGASGT